MVPNASIIGNSHSRRWLFGCRTRGIVAVWKFRSYIHVKYRGRRHRIRRIRRVGRWHNWTILTWIWKGQWIIGRRWRLWAAGDHFHWRWKRLAHSDKARTVPNRRRIHYPDVGQGYSHKGYDTQQNHEAPSFGLHGQLQRSHLLWKRQGHRTSWCPH